LTDAGSFVSARIFPVRASTPSPRAPRVAGPARVRLPRRASLGS
jgi:hypothetical protein